MIMTLHNYITESTYNINCYNDLHNLFSLHKVKKKERLNMKEFINC